jgi:hypothetical protein
VVRRDRTGSRGGKGPYWQHLDKLLDEDLNVKPKALVGAMREHFRNDAGELPADFPSDKQIKTRVGNQKHKYKYSDTGALV